MIKVHSGVDAGSGYVHTIIGTAANVHDIVETSKLVREDDEVVYGDSGYMGAAKRFEFKEDEYLSKIEMRINNGRNMEDRGLLTAFFRYRFTADTLAVQLCVSSLPTCTRDFTR